MGMFDHLKIAPEMLPVTEGERQLLLKACDGGFQTKDMKCTLTMVEITTAGRLRWEDFDYEEVPEDERPHPRAKGILGLAGSIRQINKRWVDMDDYTGYVDFCVSVDKVFFEFRATFIHGQLEDIKKITEYEQF